ncbi:hypothetical protein QAD02_019169 [Eretmocerus hayati]|uniref:Uncharacterized protein n=1 Tax=Eretmocerus hayati TaxID=131215 RepID=A0ACC2PJ42_9HYME|nr:hypothetical protein QAD02_019169 [Eretmocerus hayati]
MILVITLSLSFPSEKTEYPEIITESIEDLRDLSKSFGFDSISLLDTSVDLDNSPDGSIKIQLDHGKLSGLSATTVTDVNVEATTTTSALVKLTVPEIKSYYECSFGNVPDVCKSINTTLKNVEVELNLAIDPLVKEDLVKLSVKLVKIGNIDVNVEGGFEVLTGDLKAQLSSLMPKTIENQVSEKLKQTAVFINGLVPDFYKNMVTSAQGKSQLRILSYVLHPVRKMIKEAIIELASKATAFKSLLGL